jgi:hypothetical protein
MDASGIEGSGQPGNHHHATGAVRTSSNAIAKYPARSSLLPTRLNQEIIDLTARSAKFMGFGGPLNELPDLLLVALSRRLTVQQILNTNEPRPFFFIGIFMFPAIIYHSTEGTTDEGLANSMAPGTLKGYNRHAVHNQAYPALYQSNDQNAETRGFVCFGLSTQIHQINEFHGDLYDLRKAEVEIELEGGEFRTQPVSIFVWNGDPLSLVPVQEAVWSPSKFLCSKFYDELFARNTVEVWRERRKNPEALSKRMSPFILQSTDVSSNSKEQTSRLGE